MRIALCLFGQPRSIQTGEVFRSHRSQIIDKYQTDVFLHAWIDSSTTYQSVSEHSTRFTSGYCPINAAELLLSTYKPRSYKFEPPRTFSARPDGVLASFRNPNISNILSQLYSIEQVATLVKESDVNSYDLIIVTRFDMVFEFPDLESLDPVHFYLMDNHPTFPDLVFIFGPRYLSSQFTYSHIEDELINHSAMLENLDTFWECSNESLKMFHYRLHFSLEDLRPISIPLQRVKEDQALAILIAGQVRTFFSNPCQESFLQMLSRSKKRYSTVVLFFVINESTYTKEQFDFGLPFEWSMYEEQTFVPTLHFKRLVRFCNTENGCPEEMFYRQTALQMHQFKQGLQMIRAYENKNDVKFDIVMRSRFDLVYPEDFVPNFDLGDGKNMAFMFPHSETQRRLFIKACAERNLDLQQFVGDP